MLKQNLAKIYSLGILLSMVFCTVNVSAADTNFFDSIKGYGTEIQYIDSLEIYVAAGKGLYTSADGINWTARMSDSMNIEFFGFAYGGTAGNEKGIAVCNAITDNSKLFTTDKYLNTRSIVYAINGDDIASGGVSLNGNIIWDSYTQRFWAEARLVVSVNSNYQAGLWYSDGVVSNAQMKWYRADNDSSQITKTTTAYGGANILQCITTDGKGHIMATGRCTESTAPLRDKILLVDATGLLTVGGTVQSKKLTCNQGYLWSSSLDKYSNAIFVVSVASATTSSFRKTNWATLWALSNGGSTTGGTLFTDANGLLPTLQAAGNTMGTDSYSGRVSKILCTDDKIIMFPKCGAIPTSTTTENDIKVLTYADTNGTLSDKRQTLINNNAVIQSFLGTDTTTRISGAAVGPNGRVVVLTGKLKEGLATATNVPSKIAVIETANTVTNSSDAAQATNRGANVTITSQESIYSKILTAQEKTTISATRDTSILLDAETVYDTLGLNINAQINYTLSADIDDNVPLDMINLANREIYVFDDASYGTYEITVRATVADEPSIFTETSYKITVTTDCIISVNGTEISATEPGTGLGSYLQIGENTIAASYSKKYDAVMENAMSVIAVYNEGKLYSINLVKANVEEGMSASDVSLTFEIPQGADTSKYSYKVMFWDENMSPL